MTENTLPHTPTHIKHRPDFNEAIHCGTNKKNSKGRCTHPKGHQTDHPGYGRCWLHGGRNQSGASLTSGGQSHGQKTRIATLGQRIDSLLSDPALLTVDKELALLKDRLNSYIEEREIWESLSRKVQEKIPPPILDMETIKAINTLASTAFNMRFSNRFSVPITELQGIMTSLVKVFFNLADKYQMPAEMKEEFVLRLRGIRTLPAQDLQLAIAGSDYKQVTKLMDKYKDDPDIIDAVQ